MASTATVLLLVQAATAKGSSGDRNCGSNENNGGTVAETEAVLAAAMVETVAATTAKLRCLQQNISCGCYG